MGRKLNHSNFFNANSRQISLPFYYHVEMGVLGQGDGNSAPAISTRINGDSISINTLMLISDKTHFYVLLTWENVNKVNWRVNASFSPKL